MAGTSYSGKMANTAGERNRSFAEMQKEWMDDQYRKVQSIM